MSDASATATEKSHLIVRSSSRNFQTWCCHGLPDTRAAIAPAQHWRGFFLAAPLTCLAARGRARFK